MPVPLEAASSERIAAPAARSVWLHRIAWALLIATFPLIFMGGLVTSKQAGMSVPDWPNSYGYNMFLFPPSQWVGGILYEHVHRLKGTVVGFLAGSLMLCAWAPAAATTLRRRIGFVTIAATGLAICTGASLWLARSADSVSSDLARHLSHIPVAFGSIALFSFVAYLCRQKEPRRWVRWLTVVTFILVCIQGLLGGLRVELVAISLAVLHACLAQAFFCVAGLMVLITSRWWMQARSLRTTDLGPAGRGAFRIAAVLVLAIYVQLILGAFMRHNGAGLAIPDLPLAYGRVLPPTSAAELASVNETRVWELHLPMVTMTQVWLHFSHRVGAVVISAIVLLLLWHAIARCRPLRASAWTLLAMTAIQFTLGLLTVYLKKPADIATAHVAVGALTLLLSFIIAMVAFRIFQMSPEIPSARVQAMNSSQSAVVKGAVV